METDDRPDQPDAPDEDAETGGEAEHPKVSEPGEGMTVEEGVNDPGTAQQR